MHPHHLTNPSLFHICWKCPWSKVSLTRFPIWHSCLITDKTQRKWTSLSVFNYNYRNFVRGASFPPPHTPCQLLAIFPLFPLTSRHSCLSILLKDFDGGIHYCELIFSLFFFFIFFFTDGWEEFVLLVLFAYRTCM